MKTNEPREDEDTIVAQMAALEALFEANQGSGPASRAKSLAREARRLSPLPTTVEDHVIDVALAHLLEEAPRGALPETADPRSPWATFVTESIALAWAHWVGYRDERALGLTHKLTKGVSPPLDGDGGSPTVIAWGHAVEALVQRDEVLSHKLFLEALALGGAIAFDGLPLIQWTYGATFFHD
jgi:hypothetical protein